MSIFICGSSFPDKVVGSKRKKKNKTKPNIKRKQKLNHVSIKARQKKKKRVAQLAKAQMRGKKQTKILFFNV